MEISKKSTGTCCARQKATSNSIQKYILIPSREIGRGEKKASVGWTVARPFQDHVVACCVLPGCQSIGLDTADRISMPRARYSSGLRGVRRSVCGGLDGCPGSGGRCRRRHGWCLACCRILALSSCLRRAQCGFAAFDGSWGFQTPGRRAGARVWWIRMRRKTCAVGSKLAG